MVTATIPKGCSIGRTEKGHWATSALKEYPPAMGKALADSFFADISAVQTLAQVEIDAEYLAICKGMTVTTYGLSLGQDYAG